MEQDLETDLHFMKKAFELAEQARDEDEVPVGAIVVSNTGRIIGKGYNQTERLTDVTAHAEMLAITAAANYMGAKYLRECTLYVTLEPCAMCAGATAHAQVDRLVYGASDPNKGYRQFSEEIIHHKKEVLGGLMAEECGKLLKEFFQKKRT